MLQIAIAATAIALLRPRPPGRFRAVAHCTNGLGVWDEHGTIGWVTGESSVAACTSLTGYPRVNGYHVDWL